MKTVVLALAAIFARCMALPPPSLPSNTSLADPIRLPIDPLSSQGVTTDTTFISAVHRMKGGQLLHTIYSLIEKAWLLQTNLRVVIPFVYQGSEFSNIRIITTPTPTQQRGHSLTTTNIEYALYVVAQALQAQNGWPFSVHTRIKDKYSEQVIGSIDITEILSTSSHSSGDSTQPSLAFKSENTSRTTTISDSAANLNLTCQSAGPCPSHRVSAGRPISERAWLRLFNLMINRCFRHDESDTVRTWLPPSRSWRTTDEQSGLEMVVHFYDSALDPGRPMRLHDLVSGLLDILAQWARRDDWKTGWGLIEKDGEPEAGLQVRFREEVTA